MLFFSLKSVRFYFRNFLDRRIHCVSMQSRKRKAAEEKTDPFMVSFDQLINSIPSERKENLLSEFQTKLQTVSALSSLVDKRQRTNSRNTGSRLASIMNKNELDIITNELARQESHLSRLLDLHRKDKQSMRLVPTILSYIDALKERHDELDHAETSLRVNVAEWNHSDISSNDEDDAYAASLVLSLEDSSSIDGTELSLVLSSTSDEEEAEHSEKYPQLQIPTYAFRGSFCMNCGAYDKRLMKLNSGKDWDVYVRGDRMSKEWKESRNRLRFPWCCTCICYSCGMTPDQCTCSETFVPIATATLKIKEYECKGKTTRDYRVYKFTKENGVLDMTLFDVLEEVNCRAIEGLDDYNEWHKEFRKMWRRHYYHVNSVKSLERYVYLAYVFHHIVPKDTYCSFMYCDFLNGRRSRNHCNHHHSEIMGVNANSCTWITTGKNRYQRLLRKRHKKKKHG